MAGCTQTHGARAIGDVAEVAFRSSAGIWQRFGLQKQQPQCGSFPLSYFFKLKPKQMKKTFLRLHAVGQPSLLHPTVWRWWPAYCHLGEKAGGSFTH